MIGSCRGESQAKLCAARAHIFLQQRSLRPRSTFAIGPGCVHLLPRAEGARAQNPRHWKSCDIIEPMPSPIGHVLGGIAVGALVAQRMDWRVAAACGVAAALPDVDFLLPLQHRGPSHSLGAAVLVLAASCAGTTRTADPDRLRVIVAVTLAYASHVLLDWLGADSSSPRGVMALWPVSSAFYVSGLDLFNAVDRRYWMPGFWTRNTIALVRELVILGPLVAISVLAGRRVRSCRPRGATPPPA